MSDSYQAVYDATRSRLGNCDVGSAVEQAIRDANLGHYVEMAGAAIQSAAAPELLAALQMCLAMICEEVADGEHTEAAACAQMAIAKATGAA